MKSTTPRKPLSKRKRFEILKRDGFVCKYCGRSPAAVPLTVDHVIPIAGGGTDTPDNLVAACEDCNAGKSAVHLGNRKYEAVGKEAIEKQKEHAEQIAAFLDAQKDIEAQRGKVRDGLLGYWEFVVGPMSQSMYNMLDSLIRQYPIDVINEAIYITAKKLGKARAKFDPETALKQTKYFYGVMRNYRERGDLGLW